MIIYDVSVSTTEDIVVKAEVKESEITEVIHGSRRFKPKYITAHYVRKGNEQAKLLTVVVSGPHIKKDGTHGVYMYGNTYYSFDGRTIGAPDWVKEFANDNWPK